MSLLSGISDFFGLDIGTTAIRIAQLKGGGQNRILMHYASVAINQKIGVSDAAADQQKLAGIVKSLVSQAGIATNNVVVGIPASKVFTNIIELDKMRSDEMDKTISYQIDGYTPIPSGQAKYDWAVVGESPKDPTKGEVLISSTSSSYVEGRLDLLESVGLNVIAFEPDSLALARSLVPRGSTGQQLIIDVGNISTDLVVLMNDSPRLIRSISIGAQSLVKSVIAELNIEEVQAEQFVFKFGMSPNKLEGQIYSALLPVINTLIGEIEKSIKFFVTRYNYVAIDKIIVTGAASVLPELPLYIANYFKINVEIGNPWINVVYDASRQNELLSNANHFAVAVGLAERSV